MDFDEILENSKNMVPKRLSFDFLSNSPNFHQGSKKRKMDTTEDDRNDTMNSSAGSIGMSSWETKLLRSDLIEAQTKISQLKKEIQHQNVIQSEMELKFNAKEKAIESECTHFKTKAAEYEKLFKKNRKNDNILKEENLKLKNQLSIAKQTFDQQIFELNCKNESLRETISFQKNDLMNQISALEMKNVELSSQLSTVEEECKSFKNLSEKLKEQLEEFKGLKTELDKERVDAQEAQLKLKELEYEVKSYGDWKDLSRASHSRLNNMSDLEKEVERLRTTNKNIHDSLGNKLLLEEQVHDLEVRLKRSDASSTQQIEFKVQLESAVKELKEWKQLGSDYSSKSIANNPINLRHYIEQLLHRDLQLMSEKSNVSTEKSSIQSHLSEKENEIETYKKQVESLQKSLKSHQSVLSKLQKKLTLITAERNSQRQLLENYEKDLTVSQGSTTTAASSNFNIINTELQQSKIRVEMLEKTVSGYKDLCSKLENELAELRGHPGNPDGVINPDHYETLRRDLDSLRVENEKLKKRKNELEIEIENFTLRHNVLGNDDKFKILHFKENPTAIAQEQAAIEVAKLRAEIERLKIRNKMLETGHDDLTARLNETMNMTINIKELQNLKEQYQTLQSKYKENELLFSNVNQELREVIYMLFGYKVDRFGNSSYRITSMYSDAEHDELMFQLNPNGLLDMLETEYSQSLDGLMDQYLRCPNGGLPAFMGALTLDLINRVTMTTTT